MYKYQLWKVLFLQSQLDLTLPTTPLGPATLVPSFCSSKHQTCSGLRAFALTPPTVWNVLHLDHLFFIPSWVSSSVTSSKRPSLTSWPSEFNHSSSSDSIFSITFITLWNVIFIYKFICVLPAFLYEGIHSCMVKVLSCPLLCSQLLQ